MTPSDLMKLGLTNTEAVLYLKLLRLGASDVQTLVAETGYYKANVYNALEKLCEKGIISKIFEENKRIYQLQKPESLMELIKNKEEEILEQKKIAQKLTEDVEIAKKHAHSQETAMVFRGLAGVKQVYSEIIREKLDYLVFGSPKESDYIGDYYWQNLHVKQKENNIKAKMIFHKSLRNWKKLVPSNLIKLRFFDEKFEPLTETTVYGSKVAFVVWSDNPITTIIDNSHVADSYRLVFNSLWRQAKP